MRIGCYIGCTVLVSLLGFGGFAGVVACQFENISPNTEGANLLAVDAETKLEFPATLEEAGLVLESLAQYEGDMIEKDSSEFLVDAAALEVRNSDSREILTLEILLKFADGERSFFGTSIPGYGHVLLIEQTGATWTDQPCIGYICKVQYEYLPASDLGLVILEADDKTLVITNCSDSAKNDVWVYYKNYLPEADLYLGGITYVVRIDSIPPGEAHVLKPYRYVKGYSKVVKVSVLG